MSEQTRSKDFQEWMAKILRQQEETRATAWAWWMEDPRLKEPFMEEIRRRTRADLIEGWLDGWWDLDDDFNPVPKAKVFRIQDFPEGALMAHVMAAAEIFPSVSQARKNGWSDPIQEGEWQVTKKKILIRVIP